MRRLLLFVWGVIWRFMALGSGLGAVFGVVYGILIVPLVQTLTFGASFWQSFEYYAPLGFSLGMVSGLLWGLVMGVVEGIAFGALAGVALGKRWEGFGLPNEIWGIIYGLMSTYLCLVTLDFLVPSVDRTSSLLWAVILSNDGRTIFDDPYALTAWAMATLAFGIVGYRVAVWAKGAFSSAEKAQSSEVSISL